MPAQAILRANSNPFAAQRLITRAPALEFGAWNLEFDCSNYCLLNTIVLPLPSF